MSEPTPMGSPADLPIESCIDTPPTCAVTTRRNSKGARRRNTHLRCIFSDVARVPCATDCSMSDQPLPEELTPETVLTEAEVQKLSERFLFEDAAGAMATGPIGAASRVSLGLVVVADQVRAALWRNRRPEIKAVMDDEQGRFDKQELLAHIINNALGRPILYSTDARTVGVAADNALAKEKKDTKEAKKIADEAIRTARAAAAKDPSMLPQLAAAQAARDVALAAVLAQTYDLKLPNSTVGAVKKPADRRLLAAAAARRGCTPRGRGAVTGGEAQ